MTIYFFLTNGNFQVPLVMCVRLISTARVIVADSRLFTVTRNGSQSLLI